MYKIMNRLIFAVLVYFVSWSVSYSLIMGFDFRYYFEYLYLAWTNPGENPVFIQIIAVVLTIIVISIAFFIRKKQ
jgi:heme A synthase